MRGVVFFETIVRPIASHELSKSDYGEIAVTNGGKTIAVWGEGFSWLGPGGVWINAQT